MHKATETLRETLKRWSFWRGGERLGVAVSGGIDSMVLLHIVRHLPPSERPKIDLLHFNHKLRGRESDLDERFVRKIGQEWGIPVSIGHAPRWGRKNNLQERARWLRYEFFQKEAWRLKLKKILTAHQATDQAETFLIRWIQGAGLKGLCGIPLVREERGCHYLRPLLLVPREEIRDYAKKFKIPYREDSSNKEGKYLRNRVRRLLSQLHKINPGLDNRSSLNALLLRADEDFLSSQIETLLRPSRKKWWSLTEYKRLPSALRYRLLARFSERGAGRSYRLSSDFVLTLDHLLNSSRKEQSLCLPEGIKFHKKLGSFCFVKAG
ncbi:MAG: tRNA lysidine(34) synthetase TilS [Deltaproteobacteria bacterium]|nr:tRNA lysidine(34) synthetase TilS [Deltaproteobacteria bacterium]MBI2499888.1 tRNA lysidine(34) synthetase TilS [Deltaproteobacteria bacterium]